MKWLFWPALGCPNDWPSMLLTVTGTSGTVTWCGETWTLPADSGQTREVCPTDYTDKTTNLSSGLWRSVWWRYDTTNRQLRQTRRVYFSGGTFPTQYTTGMNANRDTQYLQVKTDKDKFDITASGTNTTHNTLSVLNINSGTKLPTYSNVVIHDGYFGSYTTSGITYTWAKGSGW